jgi:signal transduction histidine kinase
MSDERTSEQVGGRDRRSAVAVAPRAERGRVQRLLERAYQRFGSRSLITSCVVVGSLAVAVTIAVTAIWFIRYLRVPVGGALGLLAVATAIACVGFLVGLFLARDILLTIARWSSEPPTATRAIETWPAVERGPFVIISHIAGVAVVGECAVLPALVVLERHLPAYVAILIVLSILTAAGATALFMNFGLDLALRPLLEDVAAHLPAGFEPTTRSWRLRTKTVAAIPGITLFTALAVGAFADASRDPPVRFAITFAIALVLVAIATVMVIVVVRSTLDPLDELTAGTRRVLAGDLETEVPLLSTDDLGELTNSFNRMLAGLREREGLREQNLELTADLQASLTDLQHHAAELRASRERIVTAADAARRGLERDLHDGAQQQLVLLGLKLGMAERLLDRDPAAGRAAVVELREDLDQALVELRDLAHGIYPLQLESEGLPGALAEIAGRAAIPTTLDCNGAGRYPPEVETAVYFCCLEALQNSAKHAGGGAHATVRVMQRESKLEFEIADNGHGFDTTSANRSIGVQNMTDRIGALGGHLQIDSTLGRGTKVRGTVPLQPDA